MFAKKNRLRTNNQVRLNGKDGSIFITRLQGGIPWVKAQSKRDALYGQGWVHANDRQLHLFLTRIIVQGRLCELVEVIPELLQMDAYIRKLQFAPDLEKETARINARTRELLASYCQGINDFTRQNGVVAELRMLGIKPEPWEISDSLLLGKAFTYIGLASVQTDMERFLVQCIQDGIDDKRLRALFPYLTDKIDRKILAQVKLSEPLVPEHIHWLQKIPRFTASNNWVITGKRTSSGMPILAGDPHLEINRLPSVWHENALSWAAKENLKSEGQELIGASLPGIAGIFVGRNRHVSWAPTYSNMDMFDFRVEECQVGKYRRGEHAKQWKNFSLRKEIIRLRRPIRIDKKKVSHVEIDIYENEHGILEGNPYINNYYLVGNWAARYRAGAGDLSALMYLLDAKTVKEAMACFQKVESASYNWLIADTQGNIGYQMSGRLFKRAPQVSGLIAHAAWQKKYNSQGFVAAKDLPNAYNPSAQMLVTANNDLNRFAKIRAINVSSAEYRSQRIEQLLQANNMQKNKSKKKEKNPPLHVSLDVMQKMHYDTYSLQAEKFMQLLSPHLPNTEMGDSLKNWDYVYRNDSNLPTMFENIYASLMRQLFGDGAWGRETIDYLLQETTMFNNYYGLFDAVLLDKKSPWFAHKSQEKIFRAAIDEGLSMPAPLYGKKNQIIISHLLLGNRLPKFFGFDKGAFEMPGSRATIFQSQKLNFFGRPICMAPSYRFLTDMHSGEVRFNAVGGISDRRFSKLYFNRHKDWQSGNYNCLNINDLRYDPH